MAEPAKGAKSDAMRIDPALVRELAQLLTDNQLTEIEVEDGDRKIKVCRTPAAIIGAPLAPTGGAPALSAPPMRGHEDVGSAGSGTASPDVAGKSIKSPMVGTVFLSSEPSAAPFVAVGDTVKAGDTLLIIEAMKVMNPITAPESGVVKDILVANAQP
ncbi:MAG: acetyl-CoA carboxylase biotin carboxyl carrier protein subunit, partial [Sphingomicrobium sp.]